jgi:hypothetical protein
MACLRNICIINPHKEDSDDAAADDDNNNIDHGVYSYQQFLKSQNKI